ncbi:MAG: NAD(+)/NADH kinase [Actinomycetota bacterium]|nr:NAD(+)/NADH kinase [Actinomycetota bacterium]
MRSELVLGLVVHHHREEVAGLGRRVRQWAEAHGGTLRLLDEDTGVLVDQASSAATVQPADFGPGLDLCVSLGGDGTMLRAVQLTAEAEVPVLGVNAGQLGYLTEVDPGHLEETLDAWLAGRARVQERMLLEIDVHPSPGEPLIRELALNEVVVVAATNTRSVTIDAAISGRHFTRYMADGVIVATPTGSTAYSLSAGGPIVEPDFEALLVTPVAPHMVFDRSLVLAPSTEVRLTVAGYRDGLVAVDGRAIAQLAPGGYLTCKASDRRARFVVRGDRDFHTILKEKFGLSDR